MPPPPRPRAVVTGLGMVSAVGHDVETSCASARAGLTRLGPIDGPMLVDEDSGELERPYGHAVAGLTDGFWKLGRLVRLGARALADLLEEGPPPRPARTGLFVHLPGGYYGREYERRQRAETPPAPDEPELGPLDADLRVEFYSTRLGPALCEETDLAIPTEAQHLSFGDAADFVEALTLATEALAEGRYDQCLVGGIDALVESDVVEALDGVGLLKTNARPDGFLPGECAAFLRLEREDVARGRAGAVLIAGTSAAAEPFDRLSGERAAGRALYESIAHLLSDPDDEANRTGLTIAGLNGDPYRSYDWGCALVRLRAARPDFDVPAWYPALSLGEIGAASGAAAICMAARALERGYAGTDNVLAWLSGEDGKRASIALRRLAA